MGLLTRSFRSFVPLAALVAATLFVASPLTTSAQEQLQKAGDGAAAATDQPVVVITIGSIDKLMKDINYISAIIGQEQVGGMFSMMAATFTEGIDMTQPIGVLVPLVDGMPQPVGVVPTKDIKNVLKRLEAQTGPADELDDGTMVIAIGANTMYIKQQGDWAIFAADREHLKVAPLDPTPLFEGMGNKYLFAARVKPQQVPDEMRSMLVSLMRQGFDQAMEAQEQGGNESVDNIADGSFKQMEMLINETEELMLGFNVDPSSKQAVIDINFAAKAGSNLADLYAGQKATPSKFASVLRDDAVAYAHIATSIGPKAVDQTKNSIKSLLETIDGLISQQEGIGYDVQSEISAYLERIAGLVVDSVSQGRIDFGMALVPSDGGYGFVTGASVADGTELVKILKEIAGQVEYLDGAPTFKFDSEVHKGVNIHVIDADIPASLAEARELVGEHLTVYVGTSEKEVYLSAGNDAEKLLKDLIDGGATDSPGDRPIGQAHVKMLPVLKIMQDLGANETLTTMIDAMSGSDDPGVVNIASQGADNGQKLRVTLSEAMIKGLVSALMAGQELGF